MQLRFYYAQARTLQNYISEISEIIKPLKPVIIYIDQPDVKKAIDRVIDERGNDWLNAVIHYHTAQGYGKEKNLFGYEGYIKCLEERKVRELKILQALDIDYYTVSQDMKATEFSELFASVGWNCPTEEQIILLSPVQTLAKMYFSFFFKIMKMGFRPTRQNVENYIGWGSEKEEPLPNSIIKLFTISVMNMNSNASFPKWLKKGHLLNIKMPVLVMLGENEFAFSIKRATKRAKSVFRNLELHIVEEASHLLCVSKPDKINHKVLEFLMK